MGGACTSRPPGGAGRQSAVRVLRAGVDRGLAGSGDVAGAAAGAGGRRWWPGTGEIVAEFFDTGQSRTLPWARRPQAAALVAALADPDRGWDAIVIGEYERAFYGSQYASMAPLFEHYGIQLWMPEVGGRVDWHAEDHEQTDARAGPAVQAGDHPDPDPGPDRDGHPDPGAGPVPGRPPAVRVPAG